MSDLIKREDAIEAVCGVVIDEFDTSPTMGYEVAEKALSALPPADAEWIPCNKQMPDELEAVNITWVNHNPPPYYKYTKDVPLVDTAVYYKGAWYWWDATVIDLLGEYGGAYIHGIEPIDKDIEITAWMPLPTPYREENEV